jgi:hypothetical protein
MHAQFECLKEQIKSKKRLKFNSYSLIDNWDNDAGISEENYKTLQETNLERVSLKLLTKLTFPFNYGQVSYSQGQMDEEKQFSRTEAKTQSGFSRVRVKKSRIRKDKKSKKRFSDLVNKKFGKSKSQVYIGREKRGVFHGVLLLAQELEYMSLQRDGRRLANLESMNQRRLILGNFWVIREAREKALVNKLQGRGCLPVKRIKRSKRSMFDKDYFFAEHDFNLQTASKKSTKKSEKFSLVNSINKSGNKRPQQGFFETPRKGTNPLFKSPAMSHSKKDFESASYNRRYAYAKKKPRKEERRLGLEFDECSFSALKREEIEEELQEKRRLSHFGCGGEIGSFLGIGFDSGTKKMGKKRTSFGVGENLTRRSRLA